MSNAILLLIPFAVLCVCAYLTVIDHKTGIVPNKYIFVLLCIDVVMQFAFWLLIGNRSSTIAVVVVLVFLSAALYFLDVWGAGDSKLISVIILSYPFPLWNHISVAILIALPVLAFISGYIHSIATMIVSLVRGRYKAQDVLKNLNLHDIFLNLDLSGFVSIIIFLLLSKFVNPDFSSQLLIIFFTTFAVRKFIHPKINFVLMGKQKTIFFLYFLVSFAQYILGINVLTFFLISFLQLVLNILQHDNYKTVEVAQLEKGMILSMSSRMLLEGAGILPQNGRYEYVADKLNETTISQIMKWSVKNNLKLTVTIVNTVPFVSYIFVADLLIFILVSYEFFCILQ